MQTVLCIEDETEIRETIAEELVDAGYKVIQATNGKEGLDCLFQHGPDLVLCDINMPIMDGYELLSVLRRDHPHLAEVPFIFLSANADRSHVVAGKELGADAYLTKPIDFDLLTATVGARLGQIARIKEKHEQQLQQTQKLEAVGRLTSGVAHEFNNLLTAIRGFSEVASRNADDPDLVRSCLADAIEAVDHAAVITSQLLAYSRKQLCEKVIIDAGTVVADARRLLKPLLGPKTDLRIVTAAEPLRCEIDPIQFSQVFMNLAINARDAMPDGGEIAITILRQDVTAEWILDLPENIPAGRYVCFAVSDTGTGMDEATQSKIFEPFFTTKEVGEGTGLGLAVAYGIVRQSGGIIVCESALGQGTTFRVLVPEAETEPAVVDAPPASDDAPVSRGNPKRTTILVVDDEEFVIGVAKLVLDNAGYEVITADSYESALELAASRSKEIDLLICDVHLPTDDGPELVKALIRVGNDLESIFMTGNVVSMDEKYPELKSTHTCLEKPFTPEELERAVSAALSAP